MDVREEGGEGGGGKGDPINERVEEKGDKGRRGGGKEKEGREVAVRDDKHRLVFFGLALFSDCAVRKG